MAEILIIEFEGVGRSQYEAVNAELGIDSSTGEGDWPPALVSHVAGLTDGGVMTIVEVWESQEANGAFFESRLGAALEKVGVPAPARMEWIEFFAHHTP
jgi:hypothetical protein